MAFNIHLLRGEDPQAQYDAIATKDPDTLYLLQSGKGYLGDFMLFNAELEFHNASSCLAASVSSTYINSSVNTPIPLSGVRHIGLIGYASVSLLVIYPIMVEYVLCRGKYFLVS